MVETLYLYDPDFGTTTLTVGVWRATQPIVLAEFETAAEQERSEALARGMGLPFDAFLLDTEGEMRELLCRMLDFYADRFTRRVLGNTNEYMFTAALANMVFDSAADGVMYGSVKLPDVRIVLHGNEPLAARRLTSAEQAAVSLGFARSLNHMNVALTPAATAQKLVLCEAISMTMRRMDKSTYYEMATRKAIGIANGRIYWGAAQ